MTVRTATCPRCARICYQEGGVYAVEAARRLDGTAPAHRYLDDLLRQGRQDLVAKLLLRMEDLARTGTLLVPGEMNDLNHGLWEIKVQDARMPFYYNSSHPDIDSVRLTSGFKKKMRFTQRRDISFARIVWNEDLKS